MSEYPEIGSIKDFFPLKSIFVRERLDPTVPMDFIKIDLTNNSRAIILEKKYYEGLFRVKIICNNIVGWITL